MHVQRSGPRRCPATGCRDSTVDPGLIQRCHRMLVELSPFRRLSDVNSHSTITKEDTMAKSEQAHETPKRQGSASIVWFEIPADNPERAKKFCSSLFGWKIEKFPGVADYWHIDTGGGDDTPDGGLMARKHPQQPITNYVSVASVTDAAAKVEKL